jgi:hypothetical protein
MAIATPTTPRNSRRLISAPRRRNGIISAQTDLLEESKLASDHRKVNVSVEAEADILGKQANVRFPGRGHGWLYESAP